MDKLRFPETMLPGLLFNDFLDGHSLLNIYSASAIRVEEHKNVTVLYLDDSGMVIYLNRSHKEPKWVSCDLCDASVALELNWFISGAMQYEMLLGDTRIYDHPSGVLLTITWRSEGLLSYVLCLNVSS